MANQLSADTVIVGGIKTLTAGQVLKVLTGTVARSDTSAKTLFTLPNGATIVGLRLVGTVGSDAGTTATVAIGPSLLPATSVKGAAGVGVISTIGATTGVAPLGAATPVTATYAETGTASTTGGPWLVIVEVALNL